jgi:hypothetical protein
MPRLYELALGFVDYMAHTFLMQSGNVILHKNRYTMQCTPFSLCLAFKIKSSRLLQTLRVGLDNGVETCALVVNLQDSREVGLNQTHKVLVHK